MPHQRKLVQSKRFDSALEVPGSNPPPPQPPPEKKTPLIMNPNTRKLLKQVEGLGFKPRKRK